jgi:threonine/homoserine/homoserine lactone efflux protein
MIDLARAFGFASFSLALALAPGPSWVYVISSTIRQGRMAGLAAVAGNATGIVCHVTAAACGLSAIFHYWATLYTVVKWAGSLYLIFLAVRIIRERSRSESSRRSYGNKAFRRVYRDGVFVNVLNPKVSLLMLAILPQFVDISLGDVAVQFVILGALHVMIASCVLIVIVAVAARTAGVLKTRPAVETMLRWIIGTLLFGLGARMALAKAP